MAKVLNPLMSNEARGKMNGLVFNTWRGISTVKTFKSPTQPQSAAQLVMRNLMSTFSRKWQALTAAQRTAWNNWAAAHLKTDWTGNPVRITGANAYSGLNINFVRAGGAATGFDEPPAVVAPVAPDFTVSLLGGSLKLNSTTQTTTDYKKEARFIINDSPGRDRRLNEMKETTVFIASATQYELSDAQFNGAATVFARSIATVDGQTSPWTKLTALVEA